MTDEHTTPDQPQRPALDHADPSDTLMVPPPTFRERLLAAQRARANEARSMVEIPLPVQPKVAADDAAEPPTIAL